ncbi:MAG TPA: iron-containing alcohol dehydrogenase [Rhizobiales bacterium]|nr:iron-containing alcohol dehydrogenase [Hyphomicrobiales bacterium]
MPSDANFGFPTSIKFGAGRIGELGDLCKEAGINRPLLVTDPGLAAMPMVTDIVASLEKDGLGVAVFSDIKPNPVEENISDGVKAFKAGGHDGVIAFGGGSGLDAGKVIAFMQGQTRPLFDYEDVGDWWTRADPEGIAPNIAVPTTAGTGSEVGRAGLVTDSVTHAKKIIFHPLMLPTFAILDPELTVGLPAGLTAATGIDALSHNLEAYSAPSYHPFAAGIALEGMRLVKDFLPDAVANPGDLNARGQMLVASSMGATAFQRGLGAMHALAHPLGGVYDAHHGMLNAILMPYVLKANRQAIEKRIDRASRYMYIDNGFDGFMQWVLDLREKLNIPHKLADIGIPGDNLQTIAEMAVKDPSAGGNPIQFTVPQYLEIVTNAQKGEL